MARVLLFDGDCGFCTSSVRVLTRLGCTLEPVPWQRWPHLAEHGITPEAASEKLHAVDGDEVRTGHEAAAAALSSSRYALVRPLGALVRSRLVSPLAAAAYDWTSAHRDRLPGGTPACAADGGTDPR